ncbi:MAG: multicopper oxidase domain-containing protein [Deltaproteobacteria bacterium]|nr:multicopper oxidase domain-containing protein [Deltaproteobacteria bacterium]
MKSFAIFASIWPLLAWSQTVHYDLTARRQRLDMSGRGPVDFPIAINGSVPAPTLEFTEGDQAEIVVKNDLPDEELSVHWHGLLLPNPMDGVPYVTTPSIHSGESLTYRFPLRQSGTYWYQWRHRHQAEEGGVRGGEGCGGRDQRLVR